MKKALLPLAALALAVLANAKPLTALPGGEGWLCAYTADGQAALCFDGAGTEWDCWKSRGLWVCRSLDSCPQSGC